MNINEIKEKLKKQEEKATEKKEIDILAAGALKVKAETGIKKLEDNTKRVTDLLDLFAKKVPAMINNLDDINKELEVEKVINVLKEVKENSDEIIRYSNLILNEYKKVNNVCRDIQNFSKEEIKNISSLTQEKINTLSSEISKETNLKIKRNQIINLITTIAFFGLLATGVYFKFYYEKQLKFQKDKIAQIHNILTKEQKYWFDRENQKLYIKFIDK
ncbi:hypothetical protein [uncultured Fusobacterium sp.]|uniref:hypothetical protein n=1 Tax=uncultured Fusobacterium sp. TaxID=159267 RepID=UPI0025DFDED9|nr:hypothetical protein [uncultured Fusobacterium sp.]